MEKCFYNYEKSLQFILKYEPSKTSKKLIVLHFYITYIKQWTIEVCDIIRSNVNGFLCENAFFVIFQIFFFLYHASLVFCLETTHL